MLIAFLLVAIVLRKAGRAAGRRGASSLALHRTVRTVPFPLSVGSSPHDNWNTSNNLAALLAVIISSCACVIFIKDNDIVCLLPTVREPRHQTRIRFLFLWFQWLTRSD